MGLLRHWAGGGLQMRNTEEMAELFIFCGSLASDRVSSGGTQTIRKDHHAARGRVHADEYTADGADVPAAEGFYDCLIITYYLM